MKSYANLKTSKRGIFAVILYTAILAVAVVLFKLNYLTSTLLFFIPPSVYVTIRRPSMFQPLLMFSVLLGLPFVLGIDSMGLLNHAWWETSILTHRIFGLVPYETALWAILYTYFITSLYEYFLLGEDRKIHFLPRFWRFEAVVLALLCIFVFVVNTDRGLLAIPHFYAVFISVFYGIPTIVGLVRYPRDFARLWLVCLPFSAVLLMGELASLATSQWGFSGHEYLGMVSIAGQHFPVEEMLWILFGVPAFLYVYRYFTAPSAATSNLLE